MASPSGGSRRSLLTAPTDWTALAKSLARLPRRASRATHLRRAAVLVVLRDEGDLGPAALFTRRPDTLRAHPGQISFPGGSIGEGESVVDAALREAEEEVGIPRDAVETLGLLHDIDTSTGFLLTPVVARMTRDVELRLHAAEVARAFTAPLRTLSERLEVKAMKHGEREYQVPFFAFDGETIWGATGRVLVDLMKVMEMLPS